PTVNQFPIIYDDECEGPNKSAIAQVVPDLTEHLACPALVAALIDDDVFWYQLYQSGNLIDEYDSTPGFFDPHAEPSPPSGGNAVKICQAFGVGEEIKEVDEILHQWGDAEMLPEDRHLELAA